MTTIESVDAHWILDSRATPTVEATVTLSDGVSAFAQAPSTGRPESVERRDGDETRFGGNGVESAVDSVRSEISSALRGMDVADQVALDKLLVEIDGTNDRSRLGSNALLAVSAACARAGAMVRGIELWEHVAMARPASLPLPMVNLFSGNLHASGGMSIQDILIVPYAAPDEVTAIEWACDVYFAAKSLLIERSASTLVGDEGGFGAPSTSSESALALAVESIVRAGHDPSTEVGIALDIAASHKSHLDGGANESREGPYARQTRPHFRPHISPTPQDQTDTEQPMESFS